MSILGNSVGSLSNQYTWTLIGSASGAEEVLLPSDNYNELYIKVAYYGTSMFFLIPKIDITDEEKYYIDGWYASSSSYGEFYICVSSAMAKIYEVIVGGTHVIDKCVITVYCR